MVMLLNYSSQRLKGSGLFTQSSNFKAGDSEAQKAEKNVPMVKTDVKAQ